MLKALGAIVFGVVAVCGLGYVVVRKSQNAEMNTLVDQGVNNITTSLKQKAATFGAFIRSAMQDKQPIVLEESAA